MNKYHAKKIHENGYVFDSKLEHARYRELLLLRMAGKISDFEVHPKYLLQEKFKYQGKTIRAIYYIADFAYIENDKKIVEDAKGFITNVFRLKHKLFLRQYGDSIEFRITR
ncbi:MAG TPA: DUF1064 domain-containing protein [archaeon]|nr:DUF1064 domain-containing protein [archaeon]